MAISHYVVWDEYADMGTDFMDASLFSRGTRSRPSVHGDAYLYPSTYWRNRHDRRWETCPDLLRWKGKVFCYCECTLRYFISIFNFQRTICYTCHYVSVFVYNLSRVRFCDCFFLAA